MRRRRTGSPRLAAIVAAGLVVLVAGIWLGGAPSWLASGVRSTLTDNSDGRLVHEALDVITHDYYRPLNRNQLVNKGIAATVANLNDPYSHYFDPSSYRGFLIQSNPDVNGVRIDIVPDPRGLRVVDVYPGSPAARAGLQRDDLIVS